MAVPEFSFFNSLKNIHVKMFNLLIQIERT